MGELCDEMNGFERQGLVPGRDCVVEVEAKLLATCLRIRRQEVDCCDRFLSTVDGDGLVGVPGLVLGCPSTARNEVNAVAMEKDWRRILVADFQVQDDLVVGVIHPLWALVLRAIQVD